MDEPKPTNAKIEGLRTELVGLIAQHDKVECEISMLRQALWVEERRQLEREAAECPKPE